MKSTELLDLQGLSAVLGQMTLNEVTKYLVRTLYDPPSVVEYQRYNGRIGWFTEEIFGPFFSSQQRQEWLDDEESKLDNNHERYVTTFLRY